MALSVAEFTIKRKLNELRVSDIKNQLALRGLERTGVKATLIDRLKKALEEEGKDPEEYLFEIDLKKGIQFDSKDMEKEEEELANDVNQIENDADNGDLEMNTGQDINVVKEQSDVPGIMSSTPKKSGTESNQSENGAPEGLSLGDELVFSDENKTTTESADQAAESGTTRSSQDSVNTTDPHQDVDTGTSRQTENQVAHKEEDKPDLEASTTSTTTMDKEQQEQQQGSPSTAAKELPLGGKMSEPPSPDSVPVVVPFTKEDLIHMDTSAERQVDEDISLIVHIDESQMDLDNDLLNTPAKQSSTSAARASTDEAKPDAENSHSSTNGQSVSKTSRDDGSKCPEDKTDGRTDTSTASESRMKENEDKSVTSQTKDGDKAKSSEKSDVKDDKAKTIASSSRSLWISGLSSSTRATDLKTLFSKYGKVAGAKVVTNAKSPGSRCYGFVTMTTADEASKCIQHLHRTELHGKMISVERAKGDPSAQAKTASKSSSATSQKKEDRTSGSDRRDSGHERRRSRHQSSGHSREGDHHSRRSSRHRSPGSVSSSRATRERDTKDRQSKDRKSSRDKDGKSKEKDILDFEKIKAERERERLKQRERQMREEERRRMRELERMRERQHDIERRQKEEAIRLEREKQKLRLEQQRLERERLEAERERIALERERQRRERENLEREREQERLHQLRLEQERRVLKRNYDSRAGGRDEYWTDPKRLNLDRGMRYEERPGADGFVRRIERYDRRDIVPPPRPADRFEGRRDDKHDVRRPPGPHRDNKDRDDRGRAAEDRNRNIRYTDRRDGPPGRDHDRPRHDRDRSPHGPPHPNGPAHHGPPRSSPLHRQPDSRADWKSERAPPAREGRGRGGGGHVGCHTRIWRGGNFAGNVSTEVDCIKGHGCNSGPAVLGMKGNRPGGMAHDWSAGDRSTTASAPNVSSQPGDRAWSGPGGPQPAAITVQQPLLQTPPTSAAFLASAANIMMGVRMAGGRNSTQDARYDAYKTIQGGNVGRY